MSYAELLQGVEEAGLREDVLLQFADQAHVPEAAEVLEQLLRDPQLVHALNAASVQIKAYGDAALRRVMAEYDHAQKLVESIKPPPEWWPDW